MKRLYLLLVVAASLAISNVSCQAKNESPPQSSETVFADHGPSIITEACVAQPLEFAIVLQQSPVLFAATTESKAKQPAVENTPQLKNKAANSIKDWYSKGRCTFYWCA